MTQLTRVLLQRREIRMTSDLHRQKGGSKRHARHQLDVEADRSWLASTLCPVLLLDNYKVSERKEKGGAETSL